MRYTCVQYEEKNARLLAPARLLWFWGRAAAVARWGRAGVARGSLWKRTLAVHAEEGWVSELVLRLHREVVGVTSYPGK